MRVDVACYKVCSFSFCGLKISLIVLRVVCHFFLFCFFACFISLILLFCFGFVTIFVETDCYFREKLHTYSDASILFPSVSMSAGDDDCSFR